MSARAEKGDDEVVKVEKFVGDKREKAIEVPGGLVTFIDSLLPREKSKTFTCFGFNLHEVAQAYRAGKSYTSSASIKEGGVTKTVKVTVQ